MPFLSDYLVIFIYLNNTIDFMYFKTITNKLQIVTVLNITIYIKLISNYIVKLNF